MSNWIESYRGWVTPADCDIVEHMTVASYFECFGDACLAIAEVLDLGCDFRTGQRRAFATVDCYVRFMRELRVGETLHVESAIVVRVRRVDAAERPRAEEQEVEHGDAVGDIDDARLVDIPTTEEPVDRVSRHRRNVDSD